MPRVIMHVDLDAFYASVEQLRRPELRGKPVVVGGHPGERGVVAAASYEARAFGVRSAMPLSRAQRLCPNAIFVPCDFTAYREASLRVFEIFSHFSPLVEPMSLDEAYLDLTGSQALLGPPYEVALRLRDEVSRECGLDVSIGIGTSKVVAKIASDLRKPKGLVEVKPGEESAFLAALPIERLPGCGPATIDKLRPLGVRTIGELAALPLSLLTQMLGRFGEQLHEHARGIDESRVTPPGDPKSISREVTFEHDITDRVQLHDTALGLLQDVGQSLRRHSLAARTITLKLRYRPFETVTRQASLPTATDVDTHLTAALSKLIDQHLEPSRPVRLIGAGVSNLVPGATQLSLLEVGAQNRVLLDQRLDSLRERFGQQAIVRGNLTSRRQKDFRRDDLDALKTGA
jgi:DNA polymerase-4